MNRSENTVVKRDLEVNPRVLLVDDDELIHEYFKALFKTSGLLLNHAVNASEALRRIHEGYGLVITDIHMPGMDGIELLRRIKQIDANVEIIVISGDKSETTIAKAMQHGAMTYLTKPFRSTTAVLRAVHSGLDKWRETKKNEVLYRDLISGNVESVLVNGKPHAIPFYHDGFPMMQLLSLLNDGLVFLGEDSKIAFANLKFAQTLRWPYLALFGKQFVTYILREDREKFERFLGLLRQERRTGIVETRMVNRNGRIIHVVVTCRPLEVQEHGEQALALLISDISEQREAQARVDRLAKLVDRAKFEGILVHDELELIIHCNKAAEQMFGFREGEMVGVALDRLFQTPDDRPISELLEGPDAGAAIELVGMDVGGNQFPVELSASTDVDEGTSRQSGMIFVRDTTERKTAEETLRRSEENFRQLIEQSSNPIIVHRDDRLIYVNPATVSYLGYRQGEELLGQPMGEIVVVDTERSHADDAGQAQGEAREPKQTEKTLKLPDGSSKVAEMFELPIRFDGKQSILTIAHDVTERKIGEQELLTINERLQETNRQLKQLRQAESQFIANMSHELKTPLNTIGGYVSLMLDEVGGPISAKQEKWLESIKRQSNHLLSLIQDILDFAKLENKSIHITPEANNPAIIIDEVRSAAVALARDKPIRIVTEIDETLGEIVTGVARLRQILMNLVGNAIKFTDEGEVSLQVEQVDEAHVAFVVRDTGCGISGEALPKIFDDFYQVDGSATRSFGGTGLGLAIVKRLVERLKGKVEVESEVGRGSTFTVTIPKRAHSGRDSTNFPRISPA